MKKKLNQTDVQGRRQGHWKEYWHNGNLNWKGSYLDGKQIGVWKHYNREGNLKKVTYHH